MKRVECTGIASKEEKWRGGVDRERESQHTNCFIRSEQMKKKRNKDDVNVVMKDG